MRHIDTPELLKVQENAASAQIRYAPGAGPYSDSDESDYVDEIDWTQEIIDLNIDEGMSVNEVQDAMTEEGWDVSDFDWSGYE